MNFSVRENRNCQPRTGRAIREVNISQLVSGERLEPHRLVMVHVGATVIAGARRGGLNLLHAGPLPDVTDYRSIRPGPQRRVALDARQHEAGRAVDGAVAALRGVRERDDPFDPRILAADQPHGHAQRAALGIARQVFAEGQPVQFQKAVPSGALHQPQQFAPVERRAELHGPFQARAQEHAQVQLGVHHHLVRVVQFADQRVAGLAADRGHADVFGGRHFPDHFSEKMHATRMLRH
ncbi:MAG TPA: hypothetical protein VE030_11100 [Burkholderiales bacterium]|nr:hypothetical protein [Burkholderiales bacterium]